MISEELSNKIREAVKSGSLKLSGNEIEELPLFVAELKGLTSLDVSHNTLSQKDIEGLSQFAAVSNNIVSLDLSYTVIEELPPFVAKLRKLTFLGAAGNKLKELPLFVGGLEHLTSLDVKHNKLKELPPSIAELRNLVSLNIEENEIRKLPSTIANIGKLRDLAVAGNPLEFPPSEICLRGTAAIKEYLRGFLKNEGSKELYEVKLLVVGEGGVGKTSICKRLIYNTFDGQESTTCGIAIRVWKLSPVGGAQPEIRQFIRYWTLRK